jgi:SNF2 family DNA or RNA helicase
VFSQFTSYLDLVRADLDAHGIAYEYLDGSTRRRAEVIDAFRAGMLRCSSSASRRAGSDSR